MSAAETAFLHQHAIDAWSDGDDRLTRSRAAVHELAETMSASASIKEAAAILGVDRSRVSQRISGDALWAFDLHHSRRIPRWQFLGDGLLPGLGVVVPAIPADATPVAVDAFMRTPQPDFDGRTPIEFLAADGDPVGVAGFVADLARW